LTARVADGIFRHDWGRLMTDRAKADISSFIVDGVESVPPHLRGAVVAIGNFDGMHRAHQELLGKALSGANSGNRPAIVLTFEPHPRILFRPEEPLFRLTPREAKARIAKALGFDAMVVIAFDPEFSALSAADFVRTILVDGLAVDTAVVGFNFRFGAGRGGSTEFLADAGKRYGFHVMVVDQVNDRTGERISSGIVRDCLAAGDVERANAILGYRWFVSGTVAGGDRRGRELGFPTANLRLAPEVALRYGIYAVTWRRPDGSLHNAVASYGRRPTFDNGAPLLEVHLFDFSGDLYGETAIVTFFGWIRPEEKFPDAPALVARMNQDAAGARAILAAPGPGTELDRHLAAEI
jgi:riboflavin kinase/FMN adenylyltransferase